MNNLNQPTIPTEEATTSPKKQNAFLRALGFDPIAKQTKIRTELIAGCVTFLAMAYILTVNPNQIFGAGSPYWASAFIATAVAAVVGYSFISFLLECRGNEFNAKSMLLNPVNSFDFYLDLTSPQNLILWIPLFSLSLFFNI